MTKNEEMRAIEEKLNSVATNVIALNNQVVALDERVVALDSRVVALDHRVGSLDNRLAVVEREMATKTELASEAHSIRAEMRDGFHRMRIMFESLMDRINTALDFNSLTLANNQLLQNHGGRIERLEFDIELVKSAVKNSNSNSD